MLFLFTKTKELGKALDVGNTITFSGKEFEVIGILEKKGSFIFDTAMILNEDTLKENFREDDTVNVIAVKVQDIRLVNSVKENIEDLLRAERDVDEGEEDFVVESPEQTLKTLDSALFAVQLFISIIAFISIIVGGIGITNTMYTAVLERTKEIGIMKAIGARNSDILIIFVFESGFLGMMGGIIGVLIGFGIASAGGAIAAAAGFSALSPVFPLWLTIGCILFSFGVGAVSGILPAVQASRLKPVDALRYE